MRKQLFAIIKKADKLVSVRAYSEDKEELQNIQDELKLSGQPDVISHLIENYKKSQLAFKELKEAKKRIAELEKMEDSIESKPSDNQNQYLTVVEFRQQMEDFKNSLLSKVETKSEIKHEKSDTDWSRISNQELWHPDKKYRGGSIEKIERSFEAMCRYNEYAAKNKYAKLAITNQTLRAVSRVNGINVKQWLEENYETVIEEHKQYGMLNEKNPILLETYYNKKVFNVDCLVKFIRYHYLGLGEDPKKDE